MTATNENDSDGQPHDEPAVADPDTETPGWEDLQTHHDPRAHDPSTDEQTVIRLASKSAGRSFAIGVRDALAYARHGRAVYWFGVSALTAIAVCFGVALAPSVKSQPRQHGCTPRHTPTNPSTPTARRPPPVRHRSQRERRPRDIHHAIPLRPGASANAQPSSPEPTQAEAASTPVAAAAQPASTEGQTRGGPFSP
jgi:hypothetical protein